MTMLDHTQASGQEQQSLHSDRQLYRILHTHYIYIYIYIVVYKFLLFSLSLSLYIYIYIYIYIYNKYILCFIYLIPRKFVSDLRFHQVLQTTIIRQITLQSISLLVRHEPTKWISNNQHCYYIYVYKVCLYLSICSQHSELVYIYIYHYHHGVPLARISLTLTRNTSLSSIALYIYIYIYIILFSVMSLNIYVSLFTIYLSINIIPFENRYYLFWGDYVLSCGIILWMFGTTAETDASVTGFCSATTSLLCSSFRLRAGCCSWVLSWINQYEHWKDPCAQSRISFILFFIFFYSSIYLFLWLPMS